MKKDMEFDEAHKLSKIGPRHSPVHGLIFYLITENMIKGLDDDEVNFLDQVDKSRVEAEKRKAAEDKKALDEYRNAVSSLQEDSVQSRINEVIKKPGLSSSSGTAPKTSQHKLLAGAVKRKSSDIPKSSGDQNGAKRKLEETGMSFEPGERADLFLFYFTSICTPYHDLYWSAAWHWILP